MNICFKSLVYMIKLLIVIIFIDFSLLFNLIFNWIFLKIKISRGRGVFLDNIMVILM